MTTFAYLVFFALTTAGFLWSCRGTPSDARGKAFWAMTIVAMLFLFGTFSLTVASIVRGSIEVLTATALIGIGIPVFVAAEKLRDRRLERVTAA
jgi:hypothetical protein